MKCLLVLVPIFGLASAIPLNSQNLVALVSEPLSEFAPESEVPVVVVNDDVGKKSEVATIFLLKEPAQFEEGYVNADLTRERRSILLVEAFLHKLGLLKAGVLGLGAAGIGLAAGYGGGYGGYEGYGGGYGGYRAGYGGYRGGYEGYGGGYGGDGGGYGGYGGGNGGGYGGYKGSAMGNENGYGVYY